MTVFTDFGKAIKKQLIELGKPQNWLIDEVKAKTGLYFDNPYLFKIMTGKYENPKIVESIKQILEMEE